MLNNIIAFFIISRIQLLNTRSRACEIIVTKSSSRRDVFEQDGLLYAEQWQTVLHPALQAALHHAGKLRRGLWRRSTQE